MGDLYIATLPTLAGETGSSVAMDQSSEYLFIATQSGAINAIGPGDNTLISPQLIISSAASFGQIAIVRNTFGSSFLLAVDTATPTILIFAISYSGSAPSNIKQIGRYIPPENSGENNLIPSGIAAYFIGGTFRIMVSFSNSSRIHAYTFGNPEVFSFVGYIDLSGVTGSSDLRHLAMRVATSGDTTFYYLYVATNTNAIVELNVGDWIPVGDVMQFAINTQIITVTDFLSHAITFHTTSNIMYVSSRSGSASTNSGLYQIPFTPSQGTLNISTMGSPVRLLRADSVSSVNSGQLALAPGQQVDMSGIISYYYEGTGTPNIYIFIVGLTDSSIFKLYPQGGGSIGTANAVCFAKGTRILSLVDSNEAWVPIEKLHPGDLVRVYNANDAEEYRAIKFIASNKLVNDEHRFHNCMYRHKTTGLTVTGGHGILVNEISTEENARLLALGIKHREKIEDKYILIVAASNDFYPVSGSDTYEYYHFIVENDGVASRRYGAWADGMLSETPSEDFLALAPKLVHRV